MSLQKDDDPLRWIFKQGPQRGRPMLRVDPESGCWLWQGAKDRGYGRIQIMRRLFPGLRLGSKRGAMDGWIFIWIHQLTFFMKYGNPARGMELDHTCLRRCCANPDHVEARTPRENKQNRYLMPDLTEAEIDMIAEKLIEDYPTNWIATNLGFSEWAVRRVAESITRLQLDLPIEEEIPF